jgi:ATP-dependent DNA ligase
LSPRSNGPQYGIAEAVRDVPVGLFCFELLFADGHDLTRLPYPQRRARLAEAITVSPRLRLTTATEVAAPAGTADPPVRTAPSRRPAGNPRAGHPFHTV